MLDFFDEDFPLTKKQEEMIKAMEAAKKAALEETPDPAGNAPVPMAESPAADESASAEQPIQICREAAENAETASETAAEAPLGTAAEPIPEITAGPAAKSVEAMAENIPETAVETAAEAEAIPERSKPAYQSELSAEIPPEPICEAFRGDIYETDPANVCETAKKEADEPAAADISASAAEVSEITVSDIHENMRDEIPDAQPSPEAPQSAWNGEDAEIKRIFQPVSEESALPESDNQAFSYEYDSRYYAEEETPAYKYGVSSSARKRARSARTAEAKDGNITVSTKTLLKVGAVVAATAAAVRLLGKKD